MKEPAKPVTIKTIAKETGLSLSAVSKALNNYPDINENTRKMVINTALRLGYSPNLIAKSLITNTSNSIGLIVRDSTTIYGELMKPLSAEALKQDLIMLFADSHRTPEQEEKYIRQMIGSRVKGIILAPCSADVSRINSIVNGNVPIVYLGGMVQDNDENYVCVDVQKESIMAIDYLLELGHREIAFIGCTRSSTSYRIKQSTYTQMMRERGLRCKTFIDENLNASNLIGIGYEQTMKMLSDPIRFTAVFCATDFIAIGALKAIREKGLQVPHDISVIGSDGQSISGLPLIDLTTVAIPQTEMAQNLVRIVQEQAGAIGGAERQHYLSKPRLIERGSCRRI